MLNIICKSSFLSLFLLVINEGLKSVSVMEGDSVTLHTDVTEIQRNDQILWMFGPQETRIAEIYKHDIDMHESNETFGDKLQLDDQTGSLIIRNIRIKHSGLYKLQIISNRGNSYKRFNVTVYATLPIPIITRDSSQCSSSSESSSKCVLLCSVVNVTHVTLSWYKGNSLLSSISVSDLNSSLSLPLEVEYQDNNTYSCVINNPIRNQTKHLNITEVCQMCPGKDLTTPLRVYASVIPAVLLAVLAGVMYILYRKHRRMRQKDNYFESPVQAVEPVQTEEEGVEVLYAQTTFCKQVQNKKANWTEETTYASVVT
ncbi:natural killer cell receptor 2B4-like isoform X2 [Xyrauchen texanus]|uniref:natural killer cell receptor 2B4-like isoform X2 n=1 Tax=Xyrauchen texanus TaxID=154827 RepID=UPI002241DC28|nr:natural killer cell receptor 2B4-like isoform X2 [Xyrauchen texanus]